MQGKTCYIFQTSIYFPAETHPIIFQGEERQYTDAITEDQENVKQLQRQLRGWKPEKRCPVHTPESNCGYDGQGRLIRLHLSGLDPIQIPQEVWRWSSAWGFLHNAACSSPVGHVGEVWLPLLWSHLS